MELVDQPLADARGRSLTKDNVALLVDKLFDEDPGIRHLLTEVLQRQEDEIHRLQCISQQRQREIQRQEDEIHKLREELDAFREEVALERAYDRQRISRLENPIVSPTPPQEGTKTAARIEEMIGILKRRQGRAAFSELKVELKLTDSQFSKLIKKLDMRRFDVQRRPHSGKEKVLILRQQIG
jgi:hypothetical protein